VQLQCGRHRVLGGDMPVLMEDAERENPGSAACTSCLQAAIGLPRWVAPVCKFVTQVSEGMLSGVPGPPGLAARGLPGLTTRCGDGEPVWCLPVRADIRCMFAARALLVNRGFSCAVTLWMLSFLRVHLPLAAFHG
jgi:hypothetical protein